MWRVSQAVKTLGFHPRNKGSTPLPATKGVRLNGLGRYPLKVEIHGSNPCGAI